MYDLHQTFQWWKQAKCSWVPRSPWQPLVVWLPDLHGDVTLHVPGEFCGSHGPAADVQQVSRSVRGAADSSPTAPLYEALCPACSHQSHLSTGQQCNPPLWRHRIPNTNSDLDQNLSQCWWGCQGPSQVMNWCYEHFESKSSHVVVIWFSVQPAANRTSLTTLSSYPGIWKVVSCTSLSQVLNIFLYHTVHSHSIYSIYWFPLSYCVMFAPMGPTQGDLWTLSNSNVFMNHNHV